ncbi:hypothetical protein [Streptomyces sp. NPDC005907]|uniref:hypothetical protein n=1 Tax=Streptomyces sp. NPDC005907 TaxID=3154571 RepID=UPI0033C65C24
MTDHVDEHAVVPADQLRVGDVLFDVTISGIEVDEIIKAAADGVQVVWRRGTTHWVHSYRPTDPIQLARRGPDA